MKRWNILLVFFLFLFACGRNETNLETQIAVPVSVQEVKYQSIEEYITTTGTVSAIKEMTLRNETIGYYHLAVNPDTKKTYALGDFVKKGRVIIQLDNPELENNIKIESQKLNLDISKREFDKQKSLYEKGGVTLRELKNAEKAYIDAKYNYEYALLQLNKLKITAPFDGIIIDLPYYTPGTKVETNAVMVKLMDYHQLFAEVNLPGQELGRVQVNQPVRVMNYTMPEDTLWGKVTQVSPALDADTRSFKAFIVVDNPNWKLRPGMFVKADIIVAKKDSAIVIPKDIILAKRRGKTVFVVRRSLAEERTIKTGIENPDEVEVLEGLKLGERLVVKGFETLRHRSRVKVIR